MTKWKKGMLAVCSQESGSWISDLEKSREVGPQPDEIIMVKKVLFIRDEYYLAFEKYGSINVFGAKFFQPVIKDGTVDRAAEEIIQKIDNILGLVESDLEDENREERKDGFIESVLKNLRNFKRPEK